MARNPLVAKCCVFGADVQLWSRLLTAERLFRGKWVQKIWAALLPSRTHLLLSGTASMRNQCPRSPPTNFKSTRRTLQIPKVRNSYRQKSQVQKLALRMDSDLKKILIFLFVTFRHLKIWLICFLTAYIYTFIVSCTRYLRFRAPKCSLEWYDKSRRCGWADI